MGQKVHPLGFRVGITKKHQSQWFARFQKYSYSQSVLEDHMLRKTLLNLFSNLEKENSASAQLAKKTSAKKTNKAGANALKTPKITQIKIERGLIPYEIGIQVHSDDCLAITKAIDNIKLSQNLVSQLQKTRKYLFLAGEKLKTAKTNSLLVSDQLPQKGQVEQDTKTSTNTRKRKFKIQNIIKSAGKKANKSFGAFSRFARRPIKRGSLGNKRDLRAKRKQKKNLSKIVFMRLKNIKRRFKKRQSIKKRYLNIISKGLLIRKKGNLIIRNVFVKNKNKTTKVKLKYTTRKSGQQIVTKQGTTKNTYILRFSNLMYKKFAGLFLTKLNKQFLMRLKTIMKYWHNQKQAQAPLGYNKKWYQTDRKSVV